MHRRAAVHNSHTAAQPPSVLQHRSVIKNRSVRHKPRTSCRQLVRAARKSGADAGPESQSIRGPLEGLQHIIAALFSLTPGGSKPAQWTLPASTASETSQTQQAHPAAPDALAAVHPEAQWAAAWRAFEEADAEEERRQPAAAAGRQPMGRNRQASHQQQGAVASARADPADGASELSAAQLALQGLDSRARTQLLMLSLSALEQQLEALPDQAERASEADWRLLVPALLASCSLAAAQAWLGYVPAQLQDEAAQAIGQLSAGSTTCVLGRVSGAASLVERKADDGDASHAAAGQPTLWPGASSRVMLHASTVRYLRFGPRKPPVPAARPTAACSPADIAAQASSLCSGTSKQAGRQHPAACEAQVAADGGAVRQLARQRLDAAPSGIRGWRHHSLTEAWHGSTAASGPAVLHDLAVCTAEAVAQAYLGEARAGMAGGPSRPDLLLMEGCWPVFLHRGLASSRALERFRNQLAFKRWTEQRYWDVVAIYEDRHEVAVVGTGGRLMRKSIPFKRTKELEALAGWSAAMCLLMEVNDVAAPLLHRLFAHVSAALQWLLTALIGRGLGLIFRGIRQSFRRQPPRTNSGGGMPAFV